MSVSRGIKEIPDHKSALPGSEIPGSAFGYMYINGGTIIVGNDLKIGGMGEAKKDILPQFPMPI